jgi:hypothetical protein
MTYYPMTVSMFSLKNLNKSTHSFSITHRVAFYTVDYCDDLLHNPVLEFLKKSMGARNRVGWVVVPARQATQPGKTGSLESILGLLRSLKIRAWGFKYVKNNE